MTVYVRPSPTGELADRTRWSRGLLATLLAVAIGAAAQMLAPTAHAVPAPEVEYLYNVTVRRHYNFPASADALSYGHGICDKVSNGENYSQIIDAVKTEVTPNDEFASNYLISYAVGLLCAEQIWQLRNSAANYLPTEVP
jgi:uncharacterized protein DUF732